jgi:phosphohistidine phosphatase
MGRELERRIARVNVVLASTAVRVQQTVELMRAQWRTLQPDLFHTQSLYLADPKTILSQVARLDDRWKSALVVGHNPGLSQLASHLAGQPLEFPTAGLAAFKFHGDWEQVCQPGEWKLLFFCRPSDLPPEKAI